MKTSQSEYLSALLDGEAGAFECRRLLDELCRNEGLGWELGRYALIGETLRVRRTLVLAKPDFLAGIQTAIETEPVYHDTVLESAVVAAEGPAPWHTRPLLRYGVAAGLVLALAAGVMLLEGPADRTGDEQVADGRATTTPVVDSTRMTVAAMAAPVMPGQGHLNEETREILKQYVAQHVKYASTTAIVPSVRAVASRDY